MSWIAREILRHGLELQQQIEEYHRSLGRISLSYNLLAPETLANWSLAASDNVQVASGGEGLIRPNSGSSMIMADRSSPLSSEIVNLFARRDRFGRHGLRVHTHPTGKQEQETPLRLQKAKPYLDEFMTLTPNNLVDDSRKTHEAQAQDYARMASGLQRLEAYHAVLPQDREDARYEFNIGNGRFAGIAAEGDQNTIHMQIYSGDIETPDISFLHLVAMRHESGLSVGGLAYRPDYPALILEPGNIDAILSIYDILCNQPEKSELQQPALSYSRHATQEVAIDLSQLNILGL